MPKQAQSTRLISLDLIRIVAMLMVVVLHTWYNFVIRPDFFNTPIWWLLEPIVAVSKTSVLLFFILSGYLLLPKQETIFQNFKRTWSKLVIPLIVFGILSSYRFLASLQLIEVTQLEFWRAILISMLKFPNSPLWFLQVLIGLYLLNPVWRKIFNYPDRRVAQYATVGTGLVSLAIPIVEMVMDHQVHLLNSLTAWAGFAFFYLVGGMIHHKWVPTLSPKMLILTEIALLLLIILGDWLTLAAPQFFLNGYTSEYLSIPVAFLSVSLFQQGLLFNLKHLSMSPKRKRSIERQVAFLF